MNLAQQRLAELADWIRRSSASDRTPLGGQKSVGPWAVIVPTDATAAPEPDFDPAALPIFVPAEQTESVAIAAIDIGAPDSQDHMAARLGHLIWRVQAGTLPLVAIVGLESPADTLQDAIAAAGADTVDQASFPLLCVPLWHLTPAERASISGKLPLLP